jgi:hypothetical protein
MKVDCDPARRSHPVLGRLTQHVAAEQRRVVGLDDGRQQARQIAPSSAIDAMEEARDTAADRAIVVEFAHRRFSVRSKCAIAACTARSTSAG